MIAALSRRHWIPPWALAAGQLAHVLSWVLLLVIATHAPFTIGMPALAWLHLVVLGWVTLTALAVLIHAIPQFTDVEWNGELLARGTLGFYALGVALLVAAFWNGWIATLPWAGALITLALVAYLIPAGRTLGAAFGGPRREAAIARALAVTLGSLLVTALLGLGLTLVLSGDLAGFGLVLAAPIHGTFGIIGWLTQLVMGVSTRTIRPLTGSGFRVTATHIAEGVLGFFGMLGVVFGLALALPLLAWAGAIAVLAGAFIYAGDVADALGRATVTHRPPQAFVGAAALWLVAGLVLGMGTLSGQSWGPAAVYVLVIGWIAQMVNGHIHHIGIRLIATIVRGDDDETEPQALLFAPLSWLAFALFQVAVVAGALGLLLDLPEWLTAAALTGISGWLAMAANIAHAASTPRLAGTIGT